MLGIVNEAGQHVSLWADYWSVLTDPAHLAVELTVEAVTGGLAFIWGVFWVRRHDKGHHAGHTSESAPEGLSPDELVAIRKLLDYVSPQH